MAVFNKEKTLDAISNIKSKLYDILSGRKAFLEDDKAFLNIYSQLQRSYETGCLAEPAYKYLKESPSDESSDRFITNEWYTSNFSHRTLKTFFVGTKREIGKDEYRKYGVITPHEIMNEFDHVDYSKASAAFIPSGGIKSLVMYLDIIEKKLNGELKDLPVFVNDIAQKTDSYFSGLNAATGLNIGFKDMGINNFHSSENIRDLVEGFSNLHVDGKLKPAEWINYKEDFYKTLPAGKPPVFVLNTGNTEKVEEFKRCLKYFGVTTYVFKADDVFGAIKSPVERSESFSGNNAEKRLPLIEALKKGEESGSFQKFLDKYNFSKEQFFFGVHDGGLGFDERIYKHDDFKRISGLCEQAGINVDPVNSKQMIEYAGNIYNLFSLITDIAKKENKPELKRVFELDNFSFFNGSNPEKVYNFTARKENVIVLPKVMGSEIDKLKSSFFMKLPGAEFTQAQLGRRSHITGYSFEEDKFLANDTGFGNAVWTVVNSLNLTFNKELVKANHAGIVDVSIIGEKEQKKFLTRGLIKDLQNNNFINLHVKNADGKLVKKPDTTTDFQEEVLRHTDVFVLLPVKKPNENDELKDEVVRKRMVHLAKNMFSISAIYVDKMDLQTDFGAKKLVIRYMPKGAEADHSFDYIERVFQANSNNFGGKGNPNQFWVNATTPEEIAKLVYEHCEMYAKPDLPEKKNYLIPELKNLGTPCVTVFGSSSTENPEIWQASNELFAGLLEKGISVSYGGMVRGIGKGLVADTGSDKMVGVLNNEILMQRIKSKVESGEINKPSIIGVYTNESKDKEGALFADEFPKAKNAVNIIAVESDNIYHRMDIMDDVAEKNKVTPDYGSISIIAPGSNGTLEELAKNMIEGFKNEGSRKIIIWNYKNDFGGKNGGNIGYYDELIKTLCETGNFKSPKELERFGVYIEETPKGVLSKVDSFIAEAHKGKNYANDNISAQNLNKLSLQNGRY